MLPGPTINITPPADPPCLNPLPWVEISGDLPFRQALVPNKWCCPSLRLSRKKGPACKRLRESKGPYFWEVINMYGSGPLAPRRDTFPVPSQTSEDQKRDKKPSCWSSVIKRVAPRLHERLQARKLSEDPLIARFPFVKTPLWSYRKMTYSYEPNDSCPTGKLRKRLHSSSTPSSPAKRPRWEPSFKPEHNEDKSITCYPLNPVSDYWELLTGDDDIPYPPSSSPTTPTGRFYTSAFTPPSDVIFKTSAAPDVSAKAPAPVYDLRTTKITQSKLSGSAKRNDPSLRSPSPLYAAQQRERTTYATPIGLPIYGLSALYGVHYTTPVSRVQYFSLRDRELRHRELESLPTQEEQSAQSSTECLRLEGSTFHLNRALDDDDEDEDYPDGLYAFPGTDGEEVYGPSGASPYFFPVSQVQYFSLRHRERRHQKLEYRPQSPTEETLEGSLLRQSRAFFEEVDALEAFYASSDGSGAPASPHSQNNPMVQYFSLCNRERRHQGLEWFSGEQNLMESLAVSRSRHEIETDDVWPSFDFSDSVSPALLARPPVPHLQHFSFRDPERRHRELEWFPEPQEQSLTESHAVFRLRCADDDDLDDDEYDYEDDEKSYDTEERGVLLAPGAPVPSNVHQPQYEAWPGD